MRLHVRPYELMIILDATLEEAAVQAVVNRTSQALSTVGGTVVRVDKWGKRRLAYEIGHRSEGYYLLLEILLGSDAVAELDRSLRLSDEVIRHKIVRVPQHRGTRPGRGPARELVTAGPDHDA
ncbi:MAG: 30S ribosomal protein S6 [Actinomycetota bacterium]|nr:30S ribosomal protein S6 [Actinomycetota bacterium]